MKKLGLFVGGAMLIALFLTWMAVKGTAPVQAVIQPQPILGWVGWALAWLCVFGGAALIAKALTSAAPTEDPDEH